MVVADYGIVKSPQRISCPFPSLLEGRMNEGESHISRPSPAR